MDFLKKLDEEKQYLWERIQLHEEKMQELKIAIETKATDSEKSAKEAASKSHGAFNKAAEFRNKAEKKLVEISQMEESGKSALKDIRTKKTNIDNFSNFVEETRKSVISKSNTIQRKLNDSTERLDTINSLIEENSDLDEKLEIIHEEIETINKNKITAISSARTAREHSQEIKELYNQINGFYETEVVDDEENEEEVYHPGLKEELSKTYNELEDSLSTTKKELEQFVLDTKARYESTLKTYENRISKFLADSKKDHSKIVQDITDLMPNAMTAGLSEKFKVKREREEKDLESHKESFKKNINVILLISLIPIVFAAFELYRSPETSLSGIITALPQFYLALAPFYIPSFWLAFSSNKHVNLSKRLIEEYTHKEVISSTYQGISGELEKLEDDELNIDLKNQLLNNILTANSENPGKLISDYKKSDHPAEKAVTKVTDKLNFIETLEKNPSLIDQLKSLLSSKDKKSNGASPPNGAN